MRRSSRAGVTLMELVIAVSMLALLSTGVLMALRMGVNALGKANATINENRRIAGAQRIIEQQIAGFVPVIAEYMTEPDAPFLRMPFFQGEEASMRFVSTYSLGEAWRGNPQTLEFKVIPGKDGQGVMLVVNEHPYSGPRSAGVFCLGRMFDPALGLDVPLFRPIEAGANSFVLADRLGSCRFSFLAPPLPPLAEHWVSRWTLPRWPLAIRIEMTPVEANPARLQPLALTAPVRVSRQPGEVYAY